MLASTFLGREKVGRFCAFEWWPFEIVRDEVFTSFLCTTNRASAKSFQNPELQFCRFLNGKRIFHAIHIVHLSTSTVFREKLGCH